MRASGYTRRRRGERCGLYQRPPRPFPRLRSPGSCVVRAHRMESITKDQFQLPTLAPFLEGVQRELLDGRGFALLKGLPVHRYSTRCRSCIHFDLWAQSDAQQPTAASRVLPCDIPGTLAATRQCPLWCRCLTSAGRHETLCPA